MGKQGPCCHCGISTTPLWRNGPPEKPVLCNACGSRWRTKGTLLNYMPMHSGGCGASDSSDYKWVRGKKGSQKFKEQRSHKRKEPCDVDRDIEFGVAKSNLQYPKGLDEDASTRSSSVSGITYSEGCMHHGGTIEKDSTVAAQTSVWDSPVPSKKRTCMFRQRPSSVEKLTKDMQYILQEQDLSYLSCSSEEDLLYEYKAPLVAVEIGLGSVFIRQPHSAAREEESEASSLLIENKACNTSDGLTQGHAGTVATSVQLQDEDKVVTERWKEKAEVLQEQSVKSFIPNKLLLESFLQSCHSPLIFMELKDIVNFDTFTGLLKDEERMELMKYVSPVDDCGVPESLKCMFNSAQFKGALSNFQHLLAEGMFDIYGSGLSPQVQQLFQQLLIVTDLSNSKWMDRYSQLQSRIKHRMLGNSAKAPENKETTKPKGSSLPGFSKSGTYVAPKSFSGRLPGPIVAGSEKCTKTPASFQKSGPATVYPFTPVWTSSSMEGMCNENIDTGSTSKEAMGFGVGAKSGPRFNPNSLFASPPQRRSSVVLDSTGALADEGSDSVLLFDVPSNLSFPQAELLQTPVLKCKTPKDIIADASNLENPNSGGTIVNNSWDSEDNLEWDGLFWNPSYVESGQTLPNGTVLNPDKTLH